MGRPTALRMLFTAFPLACASTTSNVAAVSAQSPSQSFRELLDRSEKERK